MMKKKTDDVKKCDNSAMQKIAKVWMHFTKVNITTEIYSICQKVLMTKEGNDMSFA